MFMAVMEISHHSIGSIQVRDEELTLLQCQRLEFLAMALRKKQLNYKLFSQGPFTHIQCIVNGIAIENCGGIDVSKDIGTNPTKEKCKIKHQAHLTTSQILNSRKLTPPEKKQTIKVRRSGML
jgi:hypothetical protein